MGVGVLAVMEGGCVGGQIGDRLGIRYGAFQCDLHDKWRSREMSKEGEYNDESTAEDEAGGWMNSCEVRVAG